MTDVNETGTCSICGHEYTHFGNNAEPVNSGRCCDMCNAKEVIPARLALLYREGNPQLKDAPPKKEVKTEAKAEVKKERKPKRQSRAARWGDAVSRAQNAISNLGQYVTELDDAISELRGVQEEYEEWKENLPENLASSALGEKLDEVCNLDIESLSETIKQAVEDAEGVIDEAEGVDLPQGFGRD
jgi:DNA repair exonuclease SbcCD ATPase subunit